MKAGGNVDMVQLVFMGAGQLQNSCRAGSLLDQDSEPAGARAALQFLASRLWLAASEGVCRLGWLHLWHTACGMLQDWCADCRGLELMRCRASSAATSETLVQMVTNGQQSSQEQGIRGTVHLSADLAEDRGCCDPLFAQSCLCKPCNIPDLT